VKGILFRRLRRRTTPFSLLPLFPLLPFGGGAAEGEKGVDRVGGAGVGVNGLAIDG